MYTTLTTIMVLAGTLFSESGLETAQGRRLVADTLYWRAKRQETRRPDLTRAECLRRVALKPKQYSCWDPGERRNSTYRDINEARTRNGPIWRECVQLAEELAAGTYAPANHVTHYYNPRLCRPYWAANLVGARQIGNHIAGRVQ